MRLSHISYIALLRTHHITFHDAAWSASRPSHCILAQNLALDCIKLQFTALCTCWQTFLHPYLLVYPCYRVVMYTHTSHHNAVQCSLLSFNSISLNCTAPDHITSQQQNVKSPDTTCMSQHASHRSTKTLYFSWLCATLHFVTLPGNSVHCSNLYSSTLTITWDYMRLHALHNRQCCSHTMHTLHISTLHRL